MSEEQDDRGDGPQDRDDRPASGPPRDDRPPDDRAGGGKAAGGRPYGNKPGGRPYGNKPGGGRPYGNQPGGGRPYGNQPGGGRSYGHKPAGGRPPAGGPRNRPSGNQPGGRPPGPPGGRPYRDAERAQGGERPPQPGGGPQDRRVEYSHRDRPRGPRPQRGSWDRDRGQQRPRRDWDRDRAPRAPVGPSAAEVLSEGEEVVAGRRPVEEAFAARREALRLLVVPERRAALDQLVLHATTLRIPVVEVEGGTITAVTGFDGHQGVALVVAPRQWATLDEVLALARTRQEPPFLLALDHLEDPQNVGTLLRSAEACGVHGVIFPTKGAAPISPAAVKTSAGAVEHLLLVPMPDLAGALVDLHGRGLRVIGADGDAPMTVREADMRGPIVIVTGSEGRGLNARVRRRVDLMARIPMRGKVASLNASVAGSVFLFEAAAQRDLPEAAREPEVGETSLAAPVFEPPGIAIAEPAEALAPEPPTAATPVAEADDLLPEAPSAPAEERA